MKMPDSLLGSLLCFLVKRRILTTRWQFLPCNEMKFFRAECGYGPKYMIKRKSVLAFPVGKVRKQEIRAFEY